MIGGAACAQHSARPVAAESTPSHGQLEEGPNLVEAANGARPWVPIWFIELGRFSLDVQWTSLELLGIGYVEPRSGVGVSVSALRAIGASNHARVDVWETEINVDGTEGLTVYLPSRVGMLELLPLEVHYLHRIVGPLTNWIPRMGVWETVSGIEAYLHFSTIGYHKGGEWGGPKYRMNGRVVEIGGRVLLPLVNIRLYGYDVRLDGLDRDRQANGSYDVIFTSSGAHEKGFGVALDLILGGYFARRSQD